MQRKKQYGDDVSNINKENCGVLSLIRMC